MPRNPPVDTTAYATPPFLSSTMSFTSPIFSPLLLRTSVPMIFDARWLRSHSLMDLPVMCGDASLGAGAIVDFGAGPGFAADGVPVIEPCVLLGVDGSLFD